MTDVDDTLEITEPVDGRVARRQRNIDSVLAVVEEMFVEDAMFPTIEQVATRSGLSLRSLYRYFADPGELLEAAIKRNDERASELARLHAIGEGPLRRRIDDFVAMRLRLHDGLGPIFRATVANEARHARVRDERTRNRNLLREQFERHFAPELDAMKGADRDRVVAAGDVLTQLDSLDYLRRHRDLSVDDTRDVLTTALRSLLGS